MSFVIIFKSIIRWFGYTCNMGTIYLVNILHKFLIYSKYTNQCNHNIEAIYDNNNI
jgi:hypothetical protein